LAVFLRQRHRRYHQHDGKTEQTSLGLKHRSSNANFVGFA
jgi:hypothetical protein